MLESFRREHGEETYNKYLQSILSGCTEPPGLDEGCYDPLDGKILCRAGKASFWITWDGWLTPCGILPEPRVDLMKSEFQDAWRQLVTVTDSLRMSGVCDKCPNLQVCHPCAAVAYAETGSVEGIPIYKCHMTREMGRIAAEKLSHVEQGSIPDACENIML